MSRHRPGKDIVNGQQMGSAAVVDNPFGMAGCPGGVVQADCLPLILRKAPGKILISISNKVFVADFPNQFSSLCKRIVNVYNQRGGFEAVQSVLDHRRKFPVGDQHFRFAMIQDVGQGLSL